MFILCKSRKQARQLKHTFTLSWLKLRVNKFNLYCELNYILGYELKQQCRILTGHGVKLVTNFCSRMTLTGRVRKPMICITKEYF